MQACNHVCCRLDGFQLAAQSYKADQLSSDKAVVQVVKANSKHVPAAKLCFSCYLPACPLEEDAEADDVQGQRERKKRQVKHVAMALVLLLDHACE